MEPVSLFYEKRAQLLLKNLRARHFDACYCPNRTSALAAALRLIPQGSLVGWGGARSADQIGLQQALRDGRGASSTARACRRMPSGSPGGP